MTTDTKSEMVRRVARAIAEEQLGKGCPLDESDFACARAAMKVLQEPTEGMLRIGAGSVFGFIGHHITPEQMKLVFGAMLSAELNEPA